jgi:regulator of protease activity HflC (stomatin/prohibitin superfamily)
MFMSKDNIQLTIDTNAYFQVINPLKSKYIIGIGAVYNAVKKAAPVSIRSIVGGCTLGQILAH